MSRRRLKFLENTHTLKDVAAIFPDLKFRTVQMWIKRGVIRPSTPSSGQGFPVRFSYLNLVEVGLVWQIVRLGLDSHSYFFRVMNYVQVMKKGNRWIDGLNFDCFFIVEPKGPEPFLLIRPEELINIFNKPGIRMGWLIVDVKSIKNHVDNHLASGEGI